MLAGIGVNVASIPARSVQRALATLNRSEDVQYAEENGHAEIGFAPNDPLYGGDPLCRSAECWPYALLHLPAGWDVITGSSSIIVAVVDTGVDASHPDLAGAVVPGYNVVAGNSDTSDVNGHGTEVAGVVAARSNNGIGVAGVCGRCTILPVRVADAGGHMTWADLAKGIVYAADHGARVINVSMGGPASSSTLEQAIRYAADKGALVVASAGNAGSADPTACPGEFECGGYPAALARDIGAGLISVAAVDSSGLLAPYSNHGAWALVGAPGGAETTSFDGGYRDAIGTSVAAPFVSGVAGLVLSQDPGSTLSGSSMRSHRP